MTDLEFQEVTGLIWTDEDGQTYKRVWDCEKDRPVDIPKDE